MHVRRDGKLAKEGKVNKTRVNHMRWEKQGSVVWDQLHEQKTTNKKT